MNYKAVLFDLDGTLVHTPAEYRYRVVGEALRELGVTSSHQNMDRFWFETGRETIIKEQFGLEPALFWSTFRRYDTAELRKQSVRAYEDIGFIAELKSKGYKTGIVTGSTQTIASVEIALLGKHNFEAIVVAQTSNGIKPKPHPRCLEQGLSMLGIGKSEAIYVGNADEDIATARNAQVFDVLLMRGEYEFPETVPSLSINSLYELRPLLGL